MSIHAINAITLGISEYTGPSIIGIFEHNGRYYALTSTQLLEWTGTDDDGTGIDAIVKTGKMDFSSDKIKQMDTLYMNGTSGGNITLTTTTERDGVETDNTYTITTWTGDLYERRTQLSRGVRSRWWQVMLENIGGAALKIRDLKALVNPATRRIQG